ncbi:hypothetical protein FQA47_003963 [Oryzias melastigma]|uniref:Uncharacterized protein n=1 Tax=Oryzias melastigma TaxID=30732 RepID=A0A834F368_ORYME|nr:hypothetical protein FQA47_003963 [Oryzias melastigma]
MSDDLLSIVGILSSPHSICGHLTVRQARRVCASRSRCVLRNSLPGAIDQSLLPVLLKRYDTSSSIRLPERWTAAKPPGEERKTLSALDDGVSSFSGQRRSCSNWAVVDRRTEFSIETGSLVEAGSPNPHDSVELKSRTVSVRIQPQNNQTV